jgi:hypothetical protein
MPQNTSPAATVIKDPPAPVRLGPLTQRLLSGSKWQGTDQFPAWQVWADDLESVLAFFDRENRLADFLAVIQNARNEQHRNACLAEARGSYFLNQNCFRIVEWEPQGEGNNKGEALVSYPGSPDIFVEVKQPGWRGERLPLSTGERNRLPQAEKEKRYLRMKREKFLPGVIEGGATGPHHFAMSVVRRNALPKFTDQRPNLAIVVDDCTVTVVGLPFLAEYVQQEFLCPAHDPDDPDDRWTYERLGGVLFLQPESVGTTIEYKVDFVVNPSVLPSCALPLPVVSLFSKLRDITEEREKQRYAGVPSFSVMLKKRWALQGTDSQSN